MSNQFANQIQAKHLVWTDTDELAAIMDTLPAHCWSELSLSREEVTGALVSVSEGEYSDIWLTSSSQPYCIDTLYQRVLPSSESSLY